MSDAASKIAKYFGGGKKKKKFEPPPVPELDEEDEPASTAEYFKRSIKGKAPKKKSGWPYK